MRTTTVRLAVLGVLATTLAAAPGPAPASGSAAQPEVRIDSGVLRGSVENDVAVFKGVPYAAPPVAGLRWRTPAAPSPWRGVRVAQTFGPSCPQPRIPPPTGVEGPISEDCLTLNLWKPATSAHEKLPVMVWIHGGAFFIGSGSQPLYDAAKLASRGVIVVTFNYRLGALGFLAHPALTEEQPGGVLGNYGLLDQVAALRWVQRNIAAFGGNPENVTIFGESAGGVSVQALMASPMARGLFSKAIAQSGGGAAVFMKVHGGPGSAEAFGERWAEAVGARGADAEVLRELSVEDILSRPFVSFPNIDGRLLKRSPGDSFRRGEQADTPFIVGANSNEGSLVAMSDDLAKATLGSEYETLLAAYEERSPTPDAARGALRGELFFVQPARFLARRQAASAAPVYLYYFDQVAASERDQAAGAPHGGELPYLFGTPDAFQVEWDDRDRRIADMISGYWARFAATGDPNGEGAPRWEPVRAASPGMLRFGDQVGMVQPDALDDRMEAAAIDAAVKAWDRQD